MSIDSARARRLVHGRLPAIVGFVLVCLVASHAAHAQDVRARMRADAALKVGESFVGQADARFGTGAVSHTVAGIHFTGFEMSYPDLWNTDETGARSCAVPSCVLVAPVLLPAGALITHIELNAWDFSPPKDVTVVLKQNYLNGFPPTVLATAATSGVTGYAFVTTVLSPAHTVDNLTSTYSLTYTGADDETTKVHAVRIFYRLQTSPPPALATFADVPPNHPFFAFVEAMVAAGVTAGCAPGLFCPDALLTRGQMAAFLSRALGLHFP